MASRKAALAVAEAVPEAPSFRDRIVGLRRVKASELRRNDKNWRLHPDGQKSALQSLLKEVGFVGAVIAREVNGHLELIDGHLRTDMAADAEVPVLVVDLNDEEAKKVLATYDPLSTMAEVDQDQLAALLTDIGVDDNAELRRLLTELHSDLMVEEEEKGEDAASKREIPGMALNPHEHYDFLVVLASTTHEWNVLCERLKLAPSKRRKSMGTCRAVRADKLIALLPAKAPDA